MEMFSVGGLTSSFVRRKQEEAARHRLAEEQYEKREICKHTYRDRVNSTKLTERHI